MEQKRVFVSEAEYQILIRYASGGGIKEGENMFLVKELAEEGLLRLGFDHKKWCKTAHTTNLGKRMIGMIEK